MCTVKSFTLQPVQLILCTNLSSTARTTHPLHDLVLCSSDCATCPLQPEQLFSLQEILLQLVLCSLSNLRSARNCLLCSQYNSSSARSCPLHCEKSLFVLASRQKIPILRTENPAVDTRTICLLPIQFFLNYPCQKSYGRKIPARNNRYGRKIPAFWCQER